MAISEQEHRPSLTNIHTIELHPSPWEQEPRVMTCEFLSPGPALTRLELKHVDIPEEILDSVIRSEWYSLDKGRMFLEIRNPDVIHSKGHLPIVFTDFDDCALSTTRWHNEEYTRLFTDTALNMRQKSVIPDHGKAIYEMSKIKVPGKAEHEPRYTPRLNFVLLSQYSFFLEQHMSPDAALNIIKAIREGFAESIANDKNGDQLLLDLKIDHEILDAVRDNSPRDYLHTEFVSEIFNEPLTHLHMVVTRGKPEGLLGQIYKVHGSGILEYPVDLVLYTNDLKADALLVLSKMFPGMRSSPITLYDDNPKEVLPYLDFIRNRNINNIKVIHVRHTDSKRKDITVEGATPTETRIDPQTLTQYDIYHPNRVGTV
jgi:hypothetical protein